MLPFNAGSQVVVSALVTDRLAEAERAHRAVNEVLAAPEASPAEIRTRTKTSLAGV